MKPYRRGYRSRELALAGAALFLISLSFSGSAHGQTPGSAQAQVASTLQLTPVYDAFAGGSARAIATVNATDLTPGRQYSIQTSFRPTIAGSETLANGSSYGFTCVASRLQSAAYTCQLPLLPTAISFTLHITGSEQGSSFLWRYLSGTPAILLPDIADATYSTTIIVPRGTILSQVYSAKGAPLPVPAAVVSGNQVIYSSESQAFPSPDRTPALLVFQSTSFVPASVAITAVALAVVAFAALNFFAAGEQILQRAAGRLERGLATLLNSVPRASGRGSFRMRNLFKPRKLLALFIICAFIMVTLGALGGPDPRLRVYVVGTPAEVTQVTGSLGQIYGNSHILVITPSQDYTDFGVMSSVGQFNLAVITNYDSATLDQQQSFILPNLGNVPVIMVDNSANPQFAAEVNSLYPTPQTLDVKNASSLTSLETFGLTQSITLSQRTNVLGLQVGLTEFKLLVAVEAVLSMVLVVFGWAYIGSLTSEARAMSDLSHLVTIIGSGIFVFFFSETVYVATSSLIGVPLSLHSVTSGAHDLTAIGLLGFGGGSTPRLVAGTLGLLLGVVGVEGGLQVRKRDFALIAGLALFLFANPLAVGQFVYEAILLFLPISNVAFGAAFSSSLSLKGFIYGIGAACEEGA